MNAYTTIEESKQLIEAGLDVNTADMYYEEVYLNKNDEPCYTTPPKIGKSKFITPKQDLPCWSLAALLDIIDDNDIPYRLRNSPNSETGYFLSVKIIHQEGMNESVDIIDFDKVTGCITWLLENNYIKSNKI